MTPGNVCMRPPDVRNVKQGDGQVKAHVLRRVPCDWAELRGRTKRGRTQVDAHVFFIADASDHESMDPWKRFCLIDHPGVFRVHGDLQKGMEFWVLF